VTDASFPDRSPPRLTWTVADLQDPLPLARALIRRASVTPRDDGALDVLQRALEALGFACRRMPFTAPGTDPVDNLYARLNLAPDAPGRNLCFAGHTDVVPAGSGWSREPFAADVADGILYGRGACDMKGAIAAFVAAVARAGTEKTVVGAEKDGASPKGSVSLLITGDEEGPGVNGTKRMIETLAAEGERIDHCIVGEPSNPAILGDTIKVGRRGSLNAVLTVTGRQGHVAYPHLADNPIPRLMAMMTALTAEPLDDGSAHFDPSTLAITSIDVGNGATNVIPSQATARFNIRFNDCHDGAGLTARLRDTCAAVQADGSGSFDLAVTVTGESFLTPPGPLSDILGSAIEAVTGRHPALSTSGGTSDARFIKDIAPVVEFGLVNRTIHQADECVPVSDLNDLSEIYKQVLERYFKS